MKSAVWRFLQGTFILLLIAISVHAQPVVVGEIPKGSTSFTTIGQLVYFVSGDSLLRTDGTADGTILLRAGFEHFGQPRFVDHNGVLYFLVSRGPDFDDQWKSIWRSDGTPGGTILLRTSYDYDLDIVGQAGELVYFTASDGASGRELYRSDGTVSGTFLVKDIKAGSGSGFAGRAAALGSTLFFAGDDGIHGSELWKTDGTSAGTIMVKDIKPGAGDGFFVGKPDYPLPVFSFNRLFYFPGITTGEGLEPWITDGTTAGTRLLKDVVPGSEGVQSIQFAIANNGFLYFIIFNNPTGSDYGPADLWKTDGTSAATVKLKTLAEEGNINVFHSFLIYKGNVCFSDYWQNFQDYLWMTDGTPGGTNSFFNLFTQDGSLFFFDVIGQYILFAGSAQAIPSDLYRTEATTGSTRTVTTFQSAGPTNYPRDLTKVGGRLFYGDHEGFVNDYGNAYNAEDYYQLYQSDGDTVQSIRTLYGISTAGTEDIVDYNGKVLFTTNNTHDGAVDSRKKLWMYDPSAPAPKTASFTLVRADTDEDLHRVTNNASFFVPGQFPINIRYDPVEKPGSVVFTVNGVATRTETAPPYSLAGDVNGDYAPWQESRPGTYELKATPYSESGGKGTAGQSLTIRFTIQCDPSDEDCSFAGSILREVWTGVQGNNVSDIPLGRQPDSRGPIATFEGPVNSGTNYGARIRGYVVPPISGYYTFWIASNDHSELWLSTDESQTNKVRIAYVNGATDPRQWDKFASQQSSRVALLAGHKYYIEALHKQGVGSDNVAVGWKMPDATLERPIPGNRLLPFQPGESQPSTTRITSPTEGQTFQAPADINIEADAQDGSDGTVVNVQFYKSTGQDDFTKIGEDATAPYSFLWQDVPAGSYAITARATDADGNVVDSSPVNISVQGGACTASGTIMREYWTGIQGNNVSDIPTDTPPDGTSVLTIFEGPTNWGTNYGARIRGYICPPASGIYRFWISSNDQSELWLSTDDDPAHKTRIAYLERATGYRQWSTFSTQQSGGISLVQGKRYYIEALHKQGIGTDHVSVGWQLPDGTMERPISGSRLSPFESEMASASAQNSLYRQIDIYPNPTQSEDAKLTVTGYDGIPQRTATDVEIINMTGDVVFRERIECGGDCSSRLMNLDGQLTPGLYLVHLKTNGVQQSKRLLVK